MISKLMGSGSSRVFVLLCLSLALFPALFIVDAALSLQDNELWTRRQALISAVAAATTVCSSSCCAVAAQTVVDDDTAIDLATLNAAARVGSGGSNNSRTSNSISITNNNIIAAQQQQRHHTVVSTNDPSPNLPIRGGRSSTIINYIPRVGYSLYKTPIEQVPRCVALALRSGIRHFDVATLYGSNSIIGKPLQLYLNGGVSALNNEYYSNEKDDLLQILDNTSKMAQYHDIQTTPTTSTTTTSRSLLFAPPNMDGSAGRRSRRSQLFISHKLSNSEQSTDSISVQRQVKQTIATLGVGYLDLISIHSPLTDKARRLGTYKALLELRDAGFVRSVGVCNYGIGPLMEIQEEFVGGFDDASNLPAINQLELSPFNRHTEVVKYCDRNNIAVGCSAWSKLSGIDGPAEGWAVLSDLAKAKGMTKAQVLVRWSLQSGYICVPRSGCSSKVERVAIAENSYGGVNMMDSFVLSDKEMEVLDGLDIAYKAGKLGRRDGWEDSDVTGLEWDPTNFV